MKIKNTVITMSFAGTAALISTGNLYAAKGHGTSDVGEALARPDVSKDNGMYFYCTGDNVVIQNCEGKVAKPGKGCEGAERREVKKDDFFKELLAEITIENAEHMKPMTGADVINLNENKDEKKLADIEEFVKSAQSSAKDVEGLLEQIGKEKINDAAKEKLGRAQAKNSDLLKLLESAKVGPEIIRAAMERRDNLLKGVIGQICDSKVTINLNSLDDKDTLLHTVLKKYDPKPVVKKETLANGMLELVKREIGTGPNGTNREWWKDVTVKPALTWGPVEDIEKVKALQKKMNLTVKNEGKYPDYARAAVEYCKTLGMELPSQKDFLDALRNPESEKGTDKGFGNGQNIALKDNLPDMKDRWFWSSSPHPSIAAGALGFNGSNGGVGFGGRDYGDSSVRCVSR
jgi:hypothetical protein